MTENENKEDGLAAMAGAQDIPGEEITQEQMEAEGADNMTDAEAEDVVAKAAAQIKADPIANAVRGLAQGIIAGINKDLPADKQVDQGHPSVQMLEPALDLVYFFVSGQLRIATALETLVEQNKVLIESAGMVQSGEQPTERDKAQGV